MIHRMSWIGALRDLGSSLIDLFWAELALVRHDLVRFFVQVAKLAAFAFASLLILVYMPFLVLMAMVDGVRRIAGWESLWAPSLVVLGLVLLLLALVGGVLYLLVVRRMEGPGATVTRRLDDHRGWQRHQLYEEPNRLVEGDRL